MLPAPLPLPSDIASAAHAVQARTQAIRLELRWYATVSSTMDLAVEAVEAAAPEGVVICAEEQTAGRGRRGRVWASPAGAGLYLSLVLRPPHDPPGDRRLLSLVSLAAGVAIRDAIARATGMTTQLKWPNDVVMEGRKLAGILAEGLAIGTPDQAIVLGVGINVRSSALPPEIAARATSLEAELGRAIDRALLLEEALVALAEWYDKLRLGDTDGILRAWRAAAPGATGATVRVGRAGERGVTAGVDESGALLVRVAGRVERIVSGEIDWS